MKIDSPGSMWASSLALTQYSTRLAIWVLAARLRVTDRNCDHYGSQSGPAAHLGQKKLMDKFYIKFLILILGKLIFK